MYKIYTDSNIVKLKSRVKNLVNMILIYEPLLKVWQKIKLAYHAL